MIGLSLLFSTLAFAHFALCIKSHFRALYQRPPRALDFWLLQTFAWVLLLASLYPCLQLWGGEIGTTTWLGMIKLSALGVTALHSYRPKIFAALWRWTPGAFACRWPEPDQAQ